MASPGAYTLVNGSFGVRWAGGKVTTSIKSNNILNRTVQQHVLEISCDGVVGRAQTGFLNRFRLRKLERGVTSVVIVGGGLPASTPPKYWAA